MPTDPKLPCEKLECPFCGGNQIEKVSNFGKAQLVRQYYCKQCRSVFEHVKW
jgi:transposase-like protein